MNKLVIVSRELREVNNDSALEVVKFNFNNIEGIFTVTTLAKSNIFHLYWNGFATWSNSIEWWNDDSTFDTEKDAEFLEVFRNKFGIEIPTV